MSPLYTTAERNKLIEEKNKVDKELDKELFDEVNEALAKIKES